MVETSVTHLVQRYAPISQLNPYQGNTVSFPDSAKVKVKVAQSCLTLCDPMNYTVLGILQARILEWVAILFSRGIFPTQGSNPGLSHCRRILCQLNHQGSPHSVYIS